MNKEGKRIILFAIPDFRGGGAERVFLNLIKNISRDIFEIHVALGKFQGEYYSYLPDDDGFWIDESGQGHTVSLERS